MRLNPTCSRGGLTGLNPEDPAIADLIRKSARKLSRSPGFDLHEAEDIAQNLRTHLLEKITCYDPAKSPPLAFANLVIKQKIISIVRHRFGQCRDPRRVERSMDTIVDDVDGQASVFRDTVRAPDTTESHQMKLDVASIIDGLPESTASTAMRLLQACSNGARVATCKLSEVERALLWREFAPLLDGVAPIPPDSTLCVLNQ